MKFKTYIRMKSCPSVSMDASISPLDFRTALSGSLSAEAGPFAGEVGEIPIRMAIPFLRRRPVIASLGAFPLSLERFQVNLEKAEFALQGTLGLQGIDAKMAGKIDCATDMDVKGTVSGKVGLSHLEFGEGETEPIQEVAEPEG